jgi:S-adenosylmethionine:tRNA ribosyltransferase-isomerase
LRVDLFDFDLPDTNIALRPVVPRDSARLLVVHPDCDPLIEEAQVRDLAGFLKPGDALVFNNTKVIPAQLEGVRDRDGQQVKISATLHMRVALDCWHAFARPGKRIKPGDRLVFTSADGRNTLEAIAESKLEDGAVVLRFPLSGGDLDAAISSVGHIPLPPYIAAKRPEDAQDQSDYQTIYAAEKGAVAAPTAGLHFTPELVASLDAAGIERHFVTLHVGAGTFLPVKVDDTDDHVMHLETGSVTAQTAAALNAVKARGGRVVCVGTTSLRLLESAASEAGEILPWAGATGIFITPGYRFKVVDILMTNFHLPKSTLLMLVSAFAGVETIKTIYSHAIRTGYRFYSYGDASLLFRTYP